MNNHPLITESVSWFDRWKSIKVDFFHSRIATQLVFDINIGQLPGSDLEVDKGPIPIPNTSTLCPKKTCDYIFCNNFNNGCPITIIFGTASSKSMRHRKMVSFSTSPI